MSMSIIIIIIIIYDRTYYENMSNDFDDTTYYGNMSLMIMAT